MPVEEISPKSTPAATPTTEVPARTPTPPRPSAPTPRRAVGSFNFNPDQWTPGVGDPRSLASGPQGGPSILNRHVGISAPRLRSVSPLPAASPLPSPGLASPQRPQLRRAASSFSSAPAPNSLPPKPTDDLPSSLARESEDLGRLVDESNAFVASLMTRVHALNLAATAYMDLATYEQLSALLNGRPEFRGLDIARCVGLNLSMHVWKLLMRSILDENASLHTNSTVDEQAPGADHLAGVLYWRARHESEALGLIRISQRRASSIAETSSSRQSSINSQTSGSGSRKASLGSDLQMTRRTSGLSIEQHLPPTQE